MQKTIIRAIGRLNETWLREGVDMYVERCKPFARIEIIELPEGHRGSSKPDIEKAKRTEAEALQKGLPADRILVALDENGTQLASAAFSARLGEWSTAGKPVCFVIGGSWGLTDAILEQSDLVLSLGRMTLPHGLARLILTEQIYRAHSILAGKAYHK
jgi:23S rRNA (pseudouridine1915-N3)-methyltransferase